MRKTKFPDLIVDDPISLSGDFKFDKADRRYLDDQILAIQELLLNSLLTGATCAHYTVDSGSIAAKSCVATVGKDADGNPTVTLATGTNAAHTVGIAVTSSTAPGKIRVAQYGSLPFALHGVTSSGTPGFVVVNTTTGQPQYASSVSGSDVVLGRIDASDNLLLGAGQTLVVGVGGGGQTFTGQGSGGIGTLLASTSTAGTYRAATISDILGGNYVGMATSSFTDGQTGVSYAVPGQVVSHTVTGLGAGSVVEAVISGSVCARAVYPPGPDAGSGIVGIVLANGDVKLFDKGVLALGVGTPHVVNVKAYGAKGDGTTDDWAAIMAAIRAASGNGIAAGQSLSRRVYFPYSPNGYRVSLPVPLRIGIFYGDHGSIETPGSSLKPDNGVTGFFGTPYLYQAAFSSTAIYLQNQVVSADGVDQTKWYVALNTIAKQAGAITTVFTASDYVANVGGASNPGSAVGSLTGLIDHVYKTANGQYWLCIEAGTSAYCSVRDIAVIGAGAATDPQKIRAAGFHMEAMFSLSHCTAYNNPGNGFETFGQVTAVNGHNGGSASDESSLFRCRAAANHRNGYTFTGGDANVISVINCSAQTNEFHSYMEGSFLGSHVLHCSDDMRNDARASAYTNLTAATMGIVIGTAASAVVGHVGEIELTLLNPVVDNASAWTTGDVVNVEQVPGTTEANGRWAVYVKDPTHVVLVGSTYTHAFTGDAVNGTGLAENWTGSVNTASTSTFEACYVEGDGNNRIYGHANIYALGGGELVNDAKGVPTPRIDAVRGYQRGFSKDITGPFNVFTYLGAWDGKTTMSHQTDLDAFVSGWTLTWPNTGTTGTPSLSGFTNDDGWWTYNIGGTGGATSLAVAGEWCKYSKRATWSTGPFYVGDWRGHNSTIAHTKITSSDLIPSSASAWEVGDLCMNRSAAIGQPPAWVCTTSGGWGPGWGTLGTTPQEMGTTMVLGGYCWRLAGWTDFWLQNHAYAVGDVVKTNTDRKCLQLVDPPHFTTGMTGLANGVIVHPQVGATNATDYYVCTGAPALDTPSAGPSTWGTTVTITGQSNPANLFTFSKITTPNVSGTTDPGKIAAIGSYYYDNTCTWQSVSGGVAGGTPPAVGTPTVGTRIHDGTCIWECCGVDGATNTILTPLPILDSVSTHYEPQNVVYKGDPTTSGAQNTATRIYTKRFEQITQSTAGDTIQWYTTSQGLPVVMVDGMHDYKIRVRVFRTTGGAAGAVVDLRITVMVSGGVGTVIANDTPVVRGTAGVLDQATTPNLAHLNYSAGTVEIHVNTPDAQTYHLTADCELCVST